MTGVSGWANELVDDNSSFTGNFLPLQNIDGMFVSREIESTYSELSVRLNWLDPIWRARKVWAKQNKTTKQPNQQKKYHLSTRKHPSVEHLCASNSWAHTIQYRHTLYGTRKYVCAAAPYVVRVYVCQGKLCSAQFPRYMCIRSFSRQPVSIIQARRHVRFVPAHTQHNILCIVCARR